MKPSRIARTRLSNMAPGSASTATFLLQVSLICIFLPLFDAKPYPDKVQDLLERHRSKRYLDEARSWRYTRHAIDVLKADLNNNDLYFCRGDPFRGVQCPEEPFCSAWDQICDGEQICALEHRKECLERSEASFGRMDSRLCDGDENPKWCHWKYQAPIRCGEDFFLKPTQKKIRVRSPRYPEKYQGDYFCFWTVSVPEGHTLTVNFLRFETEANYDLFSLGTGYNRENSRSVIIFKHSGFKKPVPSQFDVNSNTVWMTFKSDDWENFRGFSIEFVDGEKKQFGVLGQTPFNREPNTDCGGKILMKPGKETIVQSPGYPEFYGNNIECEWVVSIDEGLRLRIHFEAFDVEEEEDHLSVGNGISSRRAPILYKYSSRTKPTDIISRGSDVWFKFVTSIAVARTGFKAILSEQPINECGGIFTVPSHGKMSLGSPDYPNSYPPLSDCLWQFRSASDRRIHIGFKEFDTEYGYDRVRIGNGFEPNVNGSNVELDHSGDSLPAYASPGDLTFQSAGPVAWLQFTADDFNEKNGFRFNVFSEESSPWVVDEPSSETEPTFALDVDVNIEIDDTGVELPDLQLQDQEIEDPNAQEVDRDPTNENQGEGEGGKKPDRPSTDPAEPEPHEPEPHEPQPHEPQPHEPQPHEPQPHEPQPHEPQPEETEGQGTANEDLGTQDGRPEKPGKKPKKKPTTEAPTTTTEKPTMATTEEVLTTEAESSEQSELDSYSLSSDYESGFSTSSSN